MRRSLPLRWRAPAVLIIAALIALVVGGASHGWKTVLYVIPIPLAVETFLVRSGSPRGARSAVPRCARSRGQRAASTSGSSSSQSVVPHASDSTAVGSPAAAPCQ